MSATVAEKPQILHAIPGRIRLHLPGWTGGGKQEIESQVRKESGVFRVQANPLTGNLLITFDPTITNEQTLLHSFYALDLQQLNEQHYHQPAPPPTRREKQGQTIRAHIAVRGMDRDPLLAKRVVEHLEHHPGVRAQASPLTGRVLVEFTEHEANLDDLIADVAGLELPELPEEDRPAYPLDPGPLIQSMTRTIEATLGLGFFATRRLLGFVEPLPGANTALNVASIIGILQGIPPLRYGLRKLLGRTAADLLFNIPGILSLTLAESPLGLAVVGIESLRLLTEVLARRTAWRDHEERASHAPSVQPDATIHLEYGERTPLTAKVLEGTGTATGRDGMPLPVTPGSTVPPGARLYGSSFLLQLQDDRSFQAFTPDPRPAPIASTLYDHYQRIASLSSFVYAGISALFTRSFSQTLAALLLVSPRPAAIGLDCAEMGAAARVLRGGATVVGTRPRRTIRLPNLVLLDGARLLSERLEIAEVLPLSEAHNSSEIQRYAAGVASAVDFPWTGAFRNTNAASATDGSFDGKAANASLGDVRYSLGPVEDWSLFQDASYLRQQGNYVLVLSNEQDSQPLGLLALRPQLVSGVANLVQTCRRYHIELALLSSGDQIAVRAMTQRAQIALSEIDNAIDVIRAKQQEGQIVFFVSDNVAASAGFAACDLAIGLSDDHSQLRAPADILAPDLNAVATIIEAAAHRETTVRDAVGLSTISNIVGVLWGIRGIPGIAMASRAIYISALIAIADGWLRLRGGEHHSSTIASLIDPRPERWGRKSVEEVLHQFQTTEYGLTTRQAAGRQYASTPQAHKNRLLKIVLDQLLSPLMGILAAGAGISLLFGAVGDTVIIGTTILVSVAMSSWQEQKADQTAEALQRFSTTQARVLRDGQAVMIPATELVPGDILMLAPGDRIAADARVISAQGLEVDEAALTGESLPVAKAAFGKYDTNHIVLEGTDVAIGSGQAVVVAVGKETRMGATRAALSQNDIETSPLGIRLSRMLRTLIPLSIAGGAIVIGMGLLWGQPLASLLALGATVTIAAVPEGLPLLSKVGEAGVARRLANQRAVVRRLSAVEALGRVDVACADKTGTMTRGRLQLNLVADIDHESKTTQQLSSPLRHILLAAALASPSPDAPGAASHPTDVAVIQGAIAAGLEKQLQVLHEDELPFDPARSFHATRTQEKLYLKGALEALLPRCHWILQNGEKQHLDETTRSMFAQRVLQYAEQGLRVLVVAEGTSETELDDPQGLTVLGFVGISDPLRETVRIAVTRCHDAGVRVIMITGDHPSTAWAIAQEAGLLKNGGEVLTATDITELSGDELDQRLKQAVIIARATPLDKLSIIESLQRQGHTVAMTGDGVNDAPALRLADIGIAMGGGSTEVARQTADVVITDDDFSTLVESFVEGRSFWRNIRRALALLLGGNLGELGLIVGASLLGIGAPLTARQILAMNAITDILPALAVALQPPEHRNLAGLSREGAAALGGPLRNEILNRAIATAIPSLASYMLTLGTGGLAEARAVAYASVATTQLAQTLDTGRSTEGLTKSVVGAVAGSLAVLVATFTIPPLRQFFSLVMPSPIGWLLIGGGSLLAVLLSRLLAAPLFARKII
ncbi:cation-translocating P-type ATPase [Reticulibacter mediterranei]|nr:HAD-IC family P-type ATPase [Reticulibacter mediterranei]